MLYPVQCTTVCTVKPLIKDYRLLHLIRFWIWLWEIFFEMLETHSYNWLSCFSLIFLSQVPQYFSAEPRIFLMFIYPVLYLLAESNNLYDFLACFFSKLHGRNIYFPPRNRYWRQTLNQNFIERKPFLKEMLQINLVYWGTDKSSIVHAKER